MTFQLKVSREFNAGYATVEQLSTIKPTTGGPYLHHPVICHPIGDIKAGDYINLTACYCQVSSQMPYNLMISSLVILTSKPITIPTTNKADWGADYREVTEAFGTNITNNIHHHSVQHTARLRVPYDVLNAHLTLIVYSASTAYDGTSLLTVDQDYGRLEGFVDRAATAGDLQAILDTAAQAPNPAPPPPPAPPPEPELITLQITQTQATALQEVAAAIPAA